MGDRPIISWSETMGVGVPELDAEHQLLIAQINLLNLYRKTQPRKAVEDCLTFLIEHAENHFTREELYLRAVKYPRFEEHIGRHREFMDKLSEFQDIVRETDSAEMIGKLARFIANWLDSHILTDDKDYAVAVAALAD